MTTCSRCGMELPKKSIHLFRDWPGRKEAVEKEFPNLEVSFCKNPPPPSLFDKKWRV